MVNTYTLQKLSGCSLLTVLSASSAAAISWSLSTPSYRLRLAAATASEIKNALKLHISYYGSGKLR